MELHTIGRPSRKAPSITQPQFGQRITTAEDNHPPIIDQLQRIDQLTLSNRSTLSDQLMSELPLRDKIQGLPPTLHQSVQKTADSVKKEQKAIKENAYRETGSELKLRKPEKIKFIAINENGESEEKEIIEKSPTTQGRSHHESDLIPLNQLEFSVFDPPSHDDNDNAIKNLLKEPPSKLGNTDTMTVRLHFSNKWNTFHNNIQKWFEGVEKYVHVKQAENQNETAYWHSMLDYVQTAISVSKIRLMHFKEQNERLSPVQRKTRDQELDGIMKKYHEHQKTGISFLDLKQMADRAIVLREFEGSVAGSKYMWKSHILYTNVLQALGRRYAEELNAHALNIFAPTGKLNDYLASINMGHRTDLARAHNAFFSTTFQNAPDRYESALVQCIASDLCRGIDDLENRYIHLGKLLLIQDKTSEYFMRHEMRIRIQEKDATAQMEDWFNQFNEFNPDKNSVTSDMQNRLIGEYLRKKGNRYSLTGPTSSFQQIESTVTTDATTSNVVEKSKLNVLTAAAIPKPKARKTVNVSYSSHALEVIGARGFVESAIERCMNNAPVHFNINYKSYEFYPHEREGSIIEILPSDLTAKRQKINSDNKLESQAYKYLFVVHTPRDVSPVKIITAYPTTREKANEICVLNQLSKQF